MSSLRYKTLLTYLPGMASVVNAFNSPQVQSAVYEMLMEALDSKLENEGMARVTRGEDDSRSLTQASSTSSVELAHELVQGDSIHAEGDRKATKSAATVF